MEPTERDGNDPVSVYLREIQTVPSLTRDEEAELSEHVRSQDEEAEAAGKRLVEANLPLVVSIAERYRDAGVHALDLIQRGNDALLRALNAFPEANTGAFSVHAARCVDLAISKAIADSGTPQS